MRKREKKNCEREKERASKRVCERKRTRDSGWEKDIECVMVGERERESKGERKEEERERNK